MEKDIITGCIVIVCALGFLTYLVFWSKGTIEFIARNKFRSIREILKELHERN